MKNKNCKSQAGILSIILLMLITLQGKAQCPSTLNFDVSGALCVSGTVIFDNISSSSAGGTFQFIVEGNTLSNAPFSYSFNSTGSKDVTLRRTDPNGCIDEINKSIDIGTFPVADFSINSDNNNPPCSNDPIQFTDNSIPGNGLTYMWDFDDGNFSTEKNPNISLAAFGTGTATFNVELTVTNQMGCSHSVTKQVVVIERPEIILMDDFGSQIEDFKNCEEATTNTPDFQILFTDNTSPAATNYRVDWGDGSAEYNDANPPTTHTYTSLGVFVITYFATGANGCISSREINVFNISNPSIGGGNPGNTAGCGPLSVTFPINGFENNDPSTTYTIDPGDGSGIQFFTHPPPNEFTHVYTSTSCDQPNDAFTFNITASNGCKSTPFETSAIEVHTSSEADFELDDETVCVNQNAVFDNTSIEGFNSACENSTRYEWDFGDGSDVLVVFDNSSVSHQYTTAGTYDVGLSAVNSCGTSSIVKPIIICDELPNSLFTLTGDGESINSGPDCTDTAVELILPGGACPPISLSSTSIGAETCGDTYAWSVISSADGFTFSNGESTSSNQNETISFSEGGNYVIQQTVTNACGSASSCIRVVLGQAPAMPEITGLEDGYCEGDMIDLNATINGSADSFLWTITGLDGTSDPVIAEDLTVQDPVPFDLPEGKYTIAIEVTNSCGTSQDSDVITVNAFPVAEISTDDPITACVGETILLNANTGSGFNYQWQLDGIDIPDANQASYGATVAGTYTAIVTINGCSQISNELILSFIDGPSPVISTIDNISYCDGEPISVTFEVNQETDVAYRWFKDGAPVTGETATSYTATEAGEYQVEATGTLCAVFSNSIEISSNPVPVPDFDFPLTQCQGVEASFTNMTPAIPATDLVYSWNFGDGTTEVLGEDVIHTFNTTGSFNVVLTVTTDPGNCTAQVTHQVEVVTPIDAKFDKSIIPTNLCGPLSVDFTNQSIGSNLNYSWNFGNGETSTLESPTDISFLPGVLGDTSYIVVLEVLSDVSSCPGSVSKDTITVKPIPVAQFLFETDTICADYLLPINNFSLGLSDSFIWDFGDGTPGLNTTSAGTIQHAFPYDGLNDTTYLVTLTATNDCGTSEITKPIVVTASTVEAFFNVDRISGCAPLEVEFTSNQNGFNAVTWTWGDQEGNTSTGGLTRNYTYQQPGVYQAELLVQNGCNSDRYTQEITVLPSPEVDFESVEGSCLNKKVIFNNTSPNPIGSVWDFGKGEALFNGAIPPPQIYNLPGTYDVTLTITDPVNGCRNEKTKTIEILPPPFASFSTSANACAGTPIGIQNNSNDASNFIWRFQEGGDLVFGDLSQTPVYKNAGVFTITLIAANEFDCADTVFRMINVQRQAEPNFDFVFIDGERVSPLEVGFTNLTQFPSSSEGSFNWMFPNGENHNGYDVETTMVFTNNSDTVQEQTVTLTAATHVGCTASIEKTISVLPGPCDDRLKVPNVFSPNGDGLNDVLRPLLQDGLNTYRVVTANDNLENYKMEVYSRWGESIFRSTDVEKGWNGNGNSEDIYLVVISFQCKNTDKGKFEPIEVLLKH